MGAIILILGVLAAIIVLPLLGMGLLSETGPGLAIGNFINDFFSFQWLPFSGSSINSPDYHDANYYMIGAIWWVVIIALLFWTFFWAFSDLLDDLSDFLRACAGPVVCALIGLWIMTADPQKSIRFFVAAGVSLAVLLLSALVSRLDNPRRKRRG